MGPIEPIEHYAISVAVRPRPFRAETLLRTEPHGRSLELIIAGCGLDPVLLSHCSTIVCVNDRAVPRPDWAACVPVAGDIVTVNMVPGDSGKVARSVAMMAVMVIAIAASYYFPPAMGLAAGSAEALFAGAAAGTAVSVAGSMAVNALIPPPDRKTRSSSENAGFGISGTRNTADPYGPVPRVFGKWRVYPRYAARPYTELSGSEQYLRCLFAIGKGAYALSNFKIGETALADYQGVELQQFIAGTAVANDLFPNSVYEEAVSIELSAAASWQTRSTQPAADEISLDLSFPGGLYQVHNRGNHGATDVAFEIEYAPYGTTNWIKYTAAVDLDFAGYGSESIAAGQSIAGLSSGATGTVASVRCNSEYVDTGAANDNGQPIYELRQFPIAARVQMTSGAFQAGETVRAAGAYDAVVATAATISLDVAGEFSSLYRYGVKIPVPRGQWTVRIRRITADRADDYVDDAYWTAVRSVAFEAPVNLAGVTLVALRIKASNQLNGVIDQFNCIAEAVLPVYAGGVWTQAKTRSPAWAFCEILRGSSNKRPITADSRFNLAAIQTWAANCTAEGLSFDGVLDQKGTVWEALKQVCFAGFASPGILDNRFTVVEDRVKPAPVQHISARNSWGFTGRKLFVRRPHALKCRFANEEKDYVQDERIVYDDGYSAENATLFEDVDFFGVVSSDHVWKAARRMIATARLRPEEFQVNMDVEHLVCARGSRVRLAHDVILIGLGAGRVKSRTLDAGENVTACVFDSVFPMEAGKSYVARFRREDGSSVVGAVVTNAGDQTSINFSPAIPAAWAPAVGDLALFGESGEDSIECLVMRVDPGPDATARLTLVNYDDAVYGAGSGVIPAFDSHVTQPPIDNRLPPTPKIVSTSYGLYTSDVNSDGTLDIGLTVVFEAAQSAFAQVSPPNVNALDAPDVVQGFQPQYRIAGGEWIPLPLLSASARQFFAVVRNDTTCEVRVRSYSLPGLYSDWDTATGIAIALSGTVPDNATGLQVKGGGSAWATADCVIEWTAVTAGVMVKDYKVEARTPDGLTILRSEYVVDPAYVYTFDENTADGGPRAALQFRVWARSAWGDLSSAYAALSAANAAPGNPQGLGSRSFMGGVEFYWAANAEPDFSHFLYRVKVTSGGSWGDWQRTARTGFERLLAAAEKDTHGADAAICFEVKAVDVFGQESSSSADEGVCGSLNVKESDIDDFAVSASKIFTRIPVVQGLTLTDNSPSSGYLSWSAHTIYYSGAACAIAAGNANTKYIYWKNAAAALQASDTHPASVAGWVPGEDFIIAVNIAGIGQAAWNAIANQVIGSAYIENLGVLDAHIQSISGTKIQVTSSVAIGSATFGSDGIQLEYNAGNPRFYAGDGTGNFIKFDGGQVLLAGSMQIIGGSTGNLLPNGDFAQGFSWWVNPAGSNASMSTAFQVASHQSLKIEAYGADSSEVTSVPILIDRSANYIFSAYIKTTTVTATAFYFRLKEYSDTEGAAFLQSTAVGTLFAVQDWTRSYGKFGPNGTAFHASTRSIRVEFHWENASHNPAGSAYVDAVMVEQVDSWIATPSRFSPQCAAGSVDFAVGSAAYGAKGCQIMYNNGSPQFYCGDGAANYIKFDGANSEFSTDKVNAITIKSGGDILFEGSQTNPGLIKWNCYGASGFQAGAGALSGYPRWAFYPNTSGEGIVYFGLTPTLSARYLQAFAVYTSVQGGGQGVVMRVYNSANSNYCCGLDILPGSAAANNILAIDGGGFSLVNHKVLDFGTSAGALDDVYADDFQNVADFLHLDSRDDLAAIRSIKGSGTMDERTGAEMIDDETVPEWMLSKSKETGDIARDPEGKPYISLKMMTSLLMGACRQLDAIGVEAKIRADAIETRIQALEGRRI